MASSLSRCSRIRIQRFYIRAYPGRTYWNHQHDGMAALGFVGFVQPVNQSQLENSWMGSSVCGARSPGRAHGNLYLPGVDAWGLRAHGNLVFTP